MLQTKQGKLAAPAPLRLEPNPKQALLVRSEPSVKRQTIKARSSGAWWHDTSGQHEGTKVKHSSDLI